MAQTEPTLPQNPPVVATFFKTNFHHTTLRFIHPTAFIEANLTLLIESTGHLSY